MDFSFTEEQDAIGELARQIFAGEVSVERIKAVESGADHLDRRLWATVTEAGLLGLAVGEAAGGSGGGAIELGRLLEEQGRHLAPIPLAPAVVAAAALDHFGGEDDHTLLATLLSGEAIATVAFDQPAGASWDLPATVATEGPEGWALEGWIPTVPAVGAAAAVLVPARLDGSAEVALFVLDPGSSGVVIEPVTTTGRQPAGHLVLSSAPARRLGDAGDDAVTWVAQRLMLALSAVTLGVAQEALRRAAEYTSQRQQFGRPLSSFQSTAHKAADAYIDTEAMRATLWQAAWLLDEGRDPDEATAAVLVARWWAAEGGQRVTHAVQHLHGGLGADVDYPVHRYFLWAKQLELALRSPSDDLAHLGQLVAARARAAQEAGR
jgi:alkylation response protein AidB-like acyl-CoA dehydrogenase